MTVVVQSTSYLAILTPATGAFNYVIAENQLVKGSSASYHPTASPSSSWTTSG